MIKKSYKIRKHMFYQFCDIPIFEKLQIYLFAFLI